MFVLLMAAAFAGTFLMTAAVIFAASQALLRKAEKEEEGSGPALLRDDAVSTISLWAKLLERFDFIDILQLHIAQAELEWSAGRVTWSMLLCGIVVLAAMISVGAPLWGAGLSSAAGAALPYLYILSRRARRFRKFEELFPEALEALARALRAGHAFPAGMELLASECLPPVSTEIRKTAMEGNFGTSWEQALQNLAIRVPLQDVHLFVAAAQLQNRTGGKLTDVLTKLAETMRESASLKGEVRSLAAHGKLTGAVLTALPVAIAGMMFFVNPSYLMTLYANPFGKDLIAAAVICLVAAHFVIRRLVDVRI